MAMYRVIIFASWSKIPPFGTHSMVIYLRTTKTSAPIPGINEPRYIIIIIII
jgi:hypothetical protein